MSLVKGEFGLFVARGNGVLGFCKDLAFIHLGDMEVIYSII